ncbi:hypothetical protein [Arthrobacter sp. SLBN-112]|uniref:hypothetical protein n=1 Tax=Arthrobacter sp. SLBN-112 TaxID=2768452 RepID=UPI0027AE481E|nr:hypothetical protein [Arthrobacter sp. SLBN-112]MDQ0800966.1 hypothetical protein [Arthrobacter sp. SLBN-112]
MAPALYRLGRIGPKLALARQDRLYMMVEHIFSLHVPDDPAEAIIDGDLAEAPASGQVPVTGQAAA